MSSGTRRRCGRGWQQPQGDIYGNQEELDSSHKWGRDWKLIPAVIRTHVCDFPPQLVQPRETKVTFTNK